MQRRIALLFLSLYLLTSGGGGELLKFPQLWRHYSEHQQQDRGLGFTAFLQQHYFNGDPRDADYDRDMQLPFKDCQCNLQSAVAAPPCAVQLLPPPVLFQPDSWSLPEVGTIPNAPAGSVFQPPRLS